ncbi:helix-turn-helix domain-containing protein [Deltaproteobacteria bacterium OttesenSCG-928-M10]|nr:helix-turn-helix domain-containing protein [Deltaproteobacteria bacterium OttesenSCG-928-M10]
MKDLYSIGEVAALLGISTQALRFYSNKGLIHPRHIDEQTGYRYYSYDQFHKLDRIKYLQGLGMSLSEIKEALKSGRVADFMSHLEMHRRKKEEELAAVQHTVETLDWYISYYKYLGDDRFPGLPFKRHFPERHMLAVPMSPDDPIFGPGGYRLAELKNKPLFRNLPFLRQHGYFLNFESLLDRRIVPEYYFVYLKEAVPLENESIMHLPAGEFLCFRGRLLIGQWEPELVIDLLKSLPGPALVAADEYEVDLQDFSNDIYEIQVMLVPD